MAKENNEQQVGYSSPESANSEGQRQAGSNAYPSEQEQKEAASTDKVHYSHATDASDLRSGPGTGPTMPGQFGTTASTANNPSANQAAGAAQPNSTPFRDDNASSSGLAPSHSGTYPGPGTASDRGTGNVGSTPFGTGASDNGLEATSGLDERNTTNTNSASYNSSDDVGNPLSAGGVTGSGTPGRDNQFNEMGVGEGDMSNRPTDTIAGT
ncbi:MAG: hypothetical protein J0I20_28470 [Chloroflexi bacterium]|nr:hypothetical protein [Chloroflexota bacterium]OJV96856.1 MAG: hypothetical protein BGO39_09145 [Chloroflexi bacterium 54-19]